MDAFVNDTSPDAYEKMVDAALASPHFGERWGRHWLDMARYADSDGYEKDNPRKDAWRYRDWVIKAINDDLPFDQFTIEQIAGDLLPDATQRPDSRHRLPPPDADQHRGRHRPGAVPHRRLLRPHGDHRHRVARPHRRLRALPHAQIRPAHAEGILPALRLLQQRRRSHAPGADFRCGVAGL